MKASDRWMFEMVDNKSNPRQEPVLEHKPADDGSEVTDFQLEPANYGSEVTGAVKIVSFRGDFDGLQVAHYGRLKLDRGGRVFRMGSDISHSGADISPIRTSPLLESILSPITIVTQREMLDFYCNHILYGKHGEEVQLQYIEDLHILLQSDSRLGEFVPEEVVTYLMGSLVYENILHHIKLIDIDAQDLCEVNLPNSLCNLLEADDLDLRMEAVWAIFNSIIYDDHDEQIYYPDRSSTCPYILGQTRKIAPEPSVRVFVHRWSDYVPYVKKKSSSWSLC